MSKASTTRTEAGDIVPARYNLGEEVELAYLQSPCNLAGIGGVTEVSPKKGSTNILATAAGLRFTINGRDVLVPWPNVKNCLMK